MPYIKQEARQQIDRELKSLLFLLSFLELPAGALNYIITRILLATKPDCYDDYNALIGVLECAKLELYRRRVALLEDKKKEENGDVY